MPERGGCGRTVHRRGTSGSKDFVIDHPQAPSEKELRHNTVEGPGYYTFYHGRVTLDAAGEAWVDLPSYFEALNTSPQYQLTCVGGHAPVYVAEEVRGNRFKIAGGRPGVRPYRVVMPDRSSRFGPRSAPPVGAAPLRDSSRGVRE